MTWRVTVDLTTCKVFTIAGRWHTGHFSWVIFLTILGYFLRSYRRHSWGSLQSGVQAELLTQRHRLETACSDQELLTSTIKHRHLETEGLFFPIYYILVPWVWKCVTFSLARDTKSLSSESGFGMMLSKKQKRKKLTTQKNNSINCQRQQDFHLVTKPHDYVSVYSLWNVPN